MINICTKCEKQTNKRLKRIRGMWLCPDCYKGVRNERRAENLKQLKKEGVIGLNAQEQHARCLVEGYARDKEKPRNLRIKGSKKDAGKAKGRVSQLGLYLTFGEKKVLLTKYMKEGSTYEEAKQKVNERVKDMQELTLKLREQKKSEAEIKETFKEEFNKLMLE